MTEIRPLTADEIAHVRVGSARHGRPCLPETEALRSLAADSGFAIEGHACIPNKGHPCVRVTALSAAAKRFGFRISLRHSPDKTTLYVVRVS